MGPKNKLAREGRVRKLMALTNLSRPDAEMHVDMTDGKIQNPHRAVARKKTAKTA